MSAIHAELTRSVTGQALSGSRTGGGALAIGCACMAAASKRAGFFVLIRNGRYLVDERDRNDADVMSRLGKRRIQMRHSFTYV